MVSKLRLSAETGGENELSAALGEIEDLKLRVEQLEARLSDLPTPRPSVLRRLLNSASAMRVTVARHGGYRQTARKTMRIISRDGVGGLLSRLRSAAISDDELGGFADQDNTPDMYINEVVPRRRLALGSDWHVGLIKSRTAQPEPAELPAITISAVTHNSVSWLAGFLSSLRDQQYPLHLIELILVDSASTDETVEALNAFKIKHGTEFRSIQIVERANEGFGAGHNAAIAMSTCDFVLVTNVDVLLHRASILRAILAAQADDPAVACWELAQTPYEHPKYYDPVTLETPWCSHACILLRREAVASVGGYDERIFMYGEDVELSYRLRGNGKLLRYLPWVQVTHFVELGNSSIRPHQLGGSLAASVLLRYRYASLDCAAAAERQLVRLSKLERSPTRREAFTNAVEKVKKDKQHFLTNLRPQQNVAFPFSKFDYILQRDGNDVEVPVFDGDNDLPTASIVTRTYGPSLDQLSEALAVVLNQTYPAIEHLIVEDRGAHAQQLIEDTRRDYGSNQRYLPSTGAGRGVAGNSGLHAASGDTLMLLDNDDLLFADHVSVLMNELIEEPDLVAAYSLAWDVQSTRLEEGGYSEDMHTLHPTFRMEFSKHRLRKINFMPIQAVMFRRSLYEKAGGFEEEIDELEDWYLWNSFARFGDFRLVPRLTSIYHTPADPDVRDQRQKALDKAYEPVKALIKRRLK